MVLRWRMKVSPGRHLVTMSAQLSAASALRKSMVPHARPQRIMAYLKVIQREDFLWRSHPVPSGRDNPRVDAAVEPHGGGRVYDRVRGDVE